MPNWLPMDQRRQRTEASPREPGRGPESLRLPVLMKTERRLKGPTLLTLAGEISVETLNRPAPHALSRTDSPSANPILLAKSKELYDL